MNKKIHFRFHFHVAFINDEWLPFEFKFRFDKLPNQPSKKELDYVKLPFFKSQRNEDASLTFDSYSEDQPFSITGESQTSDETNLKRIKDQLECDSLGKSKENEFLQGHTDPLNKKIYNMIIKNFVDNTKTFPIKIFDKLEVNTDDNKLQKPNE